jgi:hypothetical protein
MKNYKTIIGAAVAGLALTAVSSQAQLNLTGGIVVGQLINQPLLGIAPGGNVGAFNGTVTSWVIAGAAADPNGLIFVYQDVNNGLGPIDNAEFTGFPGPDVISAGSFLTTIGGALPFAGVPTPGAGNFPFPAVFGGTVTFENGNMPVGATSYFLAVLTTDQLFTRNFGQIQDGFSASGTILAPAAPVPEANTVVAGALMLLPLGIGAVRALRKERTA